MFKYVLLCSLLLTASAQNAATPTCQLGQYDLYYSLENQGQPRCLRFVLVTQPFANHELVCAADGGHLLDHTTPYLQGILQSILVSPIYNGANYFVGGQDVGVEGLYRWSTDGTLMTDILWMTGEPDGGTLQNCACLARPDFLMASCDCTLDRYAICETNVDFIAN